jgi:nuclear transcription factor Y gamma
MKSEEFILQELEKDKQQKAAEEGQSVETEKTGVKFMISGEAPVLMSKACELLIKDLSFRAWRHTERNRRRTLQRQDLHAAVGESEVYDFLIDIVPRVTTSKTSGPSPSEAAAAAIPQIPTGLPQMAGLPSPSLAVTAPPGTQTMNAIMDNSVMQQMQQQPQSQQQLQQGLMNFSDQQQYQTFMSPMAQMPAGDVGQVGVHLNASVAPQVQQQAQPTSQWMTQPVTNNGNAPKPG